MDKTTKCGKVIGQNLKRLRKLSRLTQVKLSSDLGINYRHYQDIEPGKADVKISTLQKFANYFKIPLHSLFHDSELRPFPLHTQKFLDHFCIAIHDPETSKYLDVCHNLTNVLGLEKSKLLETNPADFAPPKQWEGISTDEYTRDVMNQTHEKGWLEFDWTGLTEKGVFLAKVYLHRIQLGEKTYFQSFGEVPKQFMDKSDPKVQHLFL